MTSDYGGKKMIKLSNHNREDYINKIIEALHANDKQTFRKHCIELHSSDQVDIFILLTEQERKRIYSFLTPKEFSAIFSRLYYIDQQTFLEEMSSEYASNVLNNMFTDDAVRFLQRIDQDKADKLLNKMETKKAESIRKIFAHDLDTAGAVMTNEYMSISLQTTVEDTLKLIKEKGNDAEIAYYIYVIDENDVLKGVVSLKKLVTSESNDTIEQLMNKHIISIPTNMEQKDVVKVIQKYDLLAVPVVTENNELIGIITVDDIMDIAELQMTKSFNEFSTVKDANTSEYSAFKSAKKRAPWIVFLMFAGLVTSGVIGQFEDTLESVVMLAAFMPMLMDSGGNVGTQSLAISVRGIATGKLEAKNIWRKIVKEFVTGFYIGITCMVLIGILILIFYQKVMIGVVVGISLLITLSVSAVIGLIFPLILNKLKFDPAVASGPFITTVNDIVGLMIYFSIASFFMDLL